MVEKEKKQICKQEIIKNIALVEQGKPLTMPLATLNRSCEFKKIYEKTFEDEVRREYQQRPEVKAKQKEYYQRPEVKAKHKEYQQRPEVKAKVRETNRKYYQRMKRNTPESKWRIK